MWGAELLPFRREFHKIFPLKRFVATSGGFVGIAPESSREGDEVFVLPQAQVRFVFVLGLMVSTG